nr:2-polyprenyl-3-methyl-6-methoxy-1,4-benzoquinone monooxygenase [Candidatus Synchoanobacter obligatus]
MIKVLGHSPRTPHYEAYNEHSVRLMRVNYAGEVAAQGLYLGAGFFEADPRLQSFYQHALIDEFRHLDWCGSRVLSMQGRLSYCNPIWFFGAFSIGAMSRIAGPSYALGFVAETERQVLDHLKDHLDRLPQEDVRSRQILMTMIEEEEAHGEEAKRLGAVQLPPKVCQMMAAMGRVLTSVSERL